MDLKEMEDGVKVCYVFIVEKKSTTNHRYNRSSLVLLSCTIRHRTPPGLRSHLNVQVSCHSSIQRTLVTRKGRTGTQKLLSIASNPVFPSVAGPGRLLCKVHPR